MALQRDDATEDFPVEQRLQPLALGLAQEHLRWEEPNRESGLEEEEGGCRGYIYMDTQAGIPGYGFTAMSGMTL